MRHNTHTHTHTPNVEVEVHLFEPTKKCFSELKNKFAKSSSVFLNNVGISNNCGNVEIYYDQEKSGLASLHRRNLKAYDIEMSQSEMIKIITLEKYIKDRGIQHIDFMKIDIEGHELAAFNGMKEFLNPNFIDFIQFEYGGANLDSHTNLMDLYEILQSAGFHLAKIMPKGLELREYEPSMDNFNYANYVALNPKVLG